MKKKTKKAYEEYLNENSWPKEEDWIIGGRRRHYYEYKDLYGTALRKFDPIAFEVSYQEWKRVNN